MSITRGFLTSLLLSLLAAAVALAQPVGPEFRVNTYTTHAQNDPSVALDSAGNFVVVWWGRGGHEDSGIFAQRYASTGEPLGGEFRVNTFTPFSQVLPAVASDSAGNFVVVWASTNQVPGHGIFAQRYASTGAPLGEEFQVNTSSDGVFPSAASDSVGNVVVAWANYGQDGHADGIFAQRYASTGEPLGGEFRVNTFTPFNQRDASVASDSAGNFVVAWESLGQDSSDTGIFAQRYASTGEPLGGEFRVNTFTTSYQLDPSVASDSAGNFIVAWESLGQDGSDTGIFAQRYASTGAPLGGEFRVNTQTGGDQGRPSVASDSAGNFVVAWQSFGQDGSDTGISAQRYASTGAPLGGEFRVNTYTTDFQNAPSVFSDSAGNFVVAWESYRQDGYLDGVFAQRFSAACEASVQVKGDVHTPGSTLPVRIHIAHKRPETVTVPWELSLIDPWGRVVAERVTPPHTFEPGDVVDVELALPLPEDLEGGTYTLRLGISGMAGIEAATTTFRVMARVE
jgi:hypothetical protein